MRFSRLGYWSGLPFPSPEDLSNPEIEPGSPALQADSLPTELLWVHFTSFIGLLTISSVQFSHSVMSDSLRPHWLQLSRLPCPSPTPGACSNSCSSSRWCHPLLSPSPPAFSLSLCEGVFQWISFSHQVAKVLELQHQSFQWIFRVDFL